MRDCIWALTNEPMRVWQWWHRKDLLTGRRFSFKEAVRAVIETPPILDIFYDEASSQ